MPTAMMKADTVASEQTKLHRVELEQIAMLVSNIRHPPPGRPSPAGASA
jgi:hypothetical protein